MISYLVMCAASLAVAATAAEVITISDHGIGIAPDKRNLVMEPFFTTKEVGKGTGLGLSICYGIMELHGGSIEMAARPQGPGTVVTLKFPRY